MGLGVELEDFEGVIAAEGYCDCDWLGVSVEASVCEGSTNVKFPNINECVTQV